MPKNTGTIKEPPMNENEEMPRLLAQLETLQTERKQAGKKLQKLTLRLGERVKELSCLYSISKLCNIQDDVSLEEILKRVVVLIPSAWQYPEIACARIIIGHEEFKTDDFKETRWKQTANIKIKGRKQGTVEVYYLQERPDVFEGPFLREERTLIEAIAEQLGAVTQRKRVEETLRQSEQRFKQFFSNEPNYCYMISPDGIVLDVNKAALKVLGYKKKQLVGRPLRMIYAPESLPKVKQLFEKWKRNGTLRDEELNIISKDGNRRTVLLNAGAILDRDGKLLCSVSVQKDITERKQMEQEQIEQAAAIARAEEAVKSRQRIIDIQESLRKDIAQQIHGTVQNRLIVLMHQLAGLKRSSLSEEMAAEAIDLRQKLEELLEGYIRPISHRLFPAILRRGLVPALQSLIDQFEPTQCIDVELSERFKRRERINPRFITEQARLVLYRIAEEALVNATKHAKAGRITVKLGPPSKGRLHLMVRDDGRGFDIGSISAGLGIPMMQDYAEVSGGRCIINSAPGKGTEVMAEVPLAGPGAEYPERA